MEWSLNPKNLAEGWHPEFGDSVPRGDRPLTHRDNIFYGKQMRQIREDYKEEFYDGLMRRFDEFKRQVDTQMFNKQVRLAQKKERERVRRVRLGAVSAADAAMNARKKMDRERMNVIREYHKRDQMRDVIRKMLWEEPSKTWVTKENISERLNVEFVEKLFQRKHKMHPGLPEVGEYDTLQGLMNTSDIFWQHRDGSPRLVPDNKKFTSITERPIPVYHRQDDTLTEYRKETTPQFHPELGVYTPPNDEKQTRTGQLLPQWYQRVKWQEGMDSRPEDLHVPPIFTPGSEKQLDQFEDPRLLCQKAYWDALLLRVKDTEELKDKLRLVFKEFTPEGHFDDALTKVLETEDEFSREEFREKLWAIYEDFWNRMKHYHEMHHQSSKLNFDSGLRQLREDLTKWRYMVIDDEGAHAGFRKSIETPTPDPEAREKIDKAHETLEEIEKMFRAQRVGIPTLHQFIGQIDEETMKVFFTWAEQLAEMGEDIAYGKGWGLNDYNDKFTPQLQYAKMPMLDHPYSSIDASIKRTISRQVAKKNSKRARKRMQNDMEAELSNSYQKNIGRVRNVETEKKENLLSQNARPN